MTTSVTRANGDIILQQPGYSAHKFAIPQGEAVQVAKKMQDLMAEFNREPIPATHKLTVWEDDPTPGFRSWYITSNVQKHVKMFFGANDIASLIEELRKLRDLVAKEESLVIRDPNPNREFVRAVITKYKTDTWILHDLFNKPGDAEDYANYLRKQPYNKTDTMVRIIDASLWEQYYKGKR